MFWVRYRICTLLTQKLDLTQNITNENAWALTTLPWCALLVSILSQQPSIDVKMSCCDVKWRHMPWQNGSMHYTQVTPPKSVKITFFKMATLTDYDLDLQTHPRYYQRQCSCQILDPYFKWFSRESTSLTDRHTDGHTDERGK